MFRQGKPRAFIHNLRLASMLSFVAGVVNVSGVLSIQTLTTNVTGHFAFFSEEFANERYYTALLFLGYIIAFLMGAFLCGIMVEWVLRVNPRSSHALPMFVEMAVLIFVAIKDKREVSDPEWIACLLLFSMGLQNALVTKVSQATVRTTHLTGLFTDLGIELSQLFFYRGKTERRALSKSIRLRLAIIVFFFLGGVLGGYLYHYIALNTLLIAVAALMMALLYDNIRFGFHFYLRKIKRKIGSQF